MLMLTLSEKKCLQVRFMTCRYMCTVTVSLSVSVSRVCTAQGITNHNTREMAVYSVHNTYTQYEYVLYCR